MAVLSHRTNTTFISSLIPYLGVGIGVLLLTWPAAGASKVDEYASRLRSADDSRVRVQAALALGASKSSKAVAPLCGGLGDSHPTVRTASAAALARLGDKKAVSCLNKRSSVETNASVKKQISRSVAQLTSGTGRSSPAAKLVRAPSATSRWYVAVDAARNKGDRSAKEIDDLVQVTVRKALLANPHVAVAPPGESAAQAKKVLDGGEVKGYLLKPTVDAPVYANNQLTVRLSFLLLSYPTQVMQGEIAPKMTQDATPRKDLASENELIKLAAERAVSRFITIAETSK